MNHQLPDLFDYLDFRCFLADYQKARYIFDKGFSRVKLCRKLGIPNSRSYFTDVVNGKKVTSTFIDRFITILELPNEEARYFRLLVKFDQADSADEKELYFDQCLSYAKCSKFILERDAIEYYREWYHSAVRAVLDVYNFGDEYTAIAKRIYPSITARQVKSSIKLLLRLTLIEKNEEGFYKPTKETISTGLYSQDELVRHYQMQVLNLARELLVKTSKGEHSIITKLFSVSQKGFERIDRRLKTFLSEVSLIIQQDTDPADRVYHLDIQFFPGSRQDNGDRK